MKYRFFILLLLFSIYAYPNVLNFNIKWPFNLQKFNIFRFQDKQALKPVTHITSPAGQRKETHILAGKPTPPPGLKNEGNNCFGIAAFTSLFFANDVMSAYFKEARGAFKASENPINKAIGDFLDHESENYQNPKPLLMSIVGSEYGRQADSLEVIEKITQSVTELKPLPESHGNPITQDFRFTSKKNITCGSCQDSVDTLEPLTALSLPLEDNLEKSFEKYQQKDLLQDNICGNCNQRNTRYQSYSFSKLPPAMAIGIQRIINGYRNPLASTFAFEKFKPCKNLENTYKLVGLILHQGGATNGHYIAIAPGNGETETHKYSESFFVRNDSAPSIEIPRPCMRYIAKQGSLKDADKFSGGKMQGYDNFLPTAYLYLQENQKT